jgi:hypothetical protein
MFLTIYYLLDGVLGSGDTNNKVGNTRKFSQLITVHCVVAMHLNWADLRLYLP